MFDIFFKRHLIVLVICYLAVGHSLQSQDRLNVDLYDNLVLADERYSGSWYYVDELGNEYALLGAKSGTAVIQLVEQDSSVVRGFISGPSSNWREITVIGDYAFVSTEGGADSVGMHVIDLSPLPIDTAYLLTEYKQTFGKGHIIQRDIYSDAPYVYVIGTVATEGVHILDVSEPAAPIEVGLYDPDYYIHDAHINGDLMFCAAFYEARMDIVDISDKSNPTLIATIDDPGVNTHSCWLTEDKKHLFLCDEADGFYARIFNIEDLDNIFEEATYSANLESLVHNPYIRGDFAYISHNTEGLRIVDVADPTCPVEVGYYDTFDGPSGGFSGLWSACPFLPSGKIIGGDRTKGMFVWTFNNTSAARIYGQVVESVTGKPIENATIEIEALDTLLFSDSDGFYKIGFYPEAVSLSISAVGYHGKTELFEFQNGSNETIVTSLGDMVSTNNPTELPTFSISPNPAKDVIRFVFNSAFLPSSVRILDAQGQLIEEHNLNNNDKTQLSVSHLASGHYFVQLPNGASAAFVKL